ncbi:MAG: hypothetical protein AAF501_03635 [Pseudomonadota bacterium]
MANMGQVLVILEMIFFFGGILAFGWWQVRLMRRELAESAAAEAASDGPAEVERHPT